MTREKKLKIALDLNHIALLITNEDFQKVKCWLEEIEAIVKAEPTEEKEDA